MSDDTITLAPGKYTVDSKTGITRMSREDEIRDAYIQTAIDRGARVQWILDTTFKRVAIVPEDFTHAYNHQQKKIDELEEAHRQLMAVHMHQETTIAELQENIDSYMHEIDRHR